MPPLAIRHHVRWRPIAIAFGIALASAGTAAANCANGDPPCVTRLTERGGFVTVHWAGNRKWGHYNIRQHGTSEQFEAPGTNRNQLINQRSMRMSRRYVSGNRVAFIIQGCSKRLLGSSRCSPWSAPASIMIDDGTGVGDSAKSRACRNYANRAVGAVKLARDTYKCDPQTIRGPRWSTDFNEHLRWCMRAEPRTANFEDRARTRIMHRCRLHRPTGALRLSVVRGAGDFFTVSGSGFPANAPVVLRLSGAAAQTSTITSGNNGLIVANAQGSFSARVNGIVVCKRAGPVTFVAEERDHGRKSNAANVTCRPN